MADSYSMLRARPYHSQKVRAAAYLGPVFRGSGEGSFAGSFPDGVTSQEGVPTSAEVIVRARATGTSFDGAVVARVASNSSGEWLVPHLPEGIAFDVVARKDGECDVIKSNVVPLSPLKLLAPRVFYTPIGVTRTLSLKAIGGEPPYTLSIVGGTPPASLSIDGLDLVATAPTESPGVYPITLELEDARAETVQLEMEVELVLLRFSFSYPHSTHAIPDEPFSLVPDLVGPQPPVAFDVVDGALPTGLSLDPDTGEISGTPTVDGTYTFTIGAEDAQAQTYEEEVTIVVADDVG